MRLGALLITVLLTAACLAPSGAATTEETAGPSPRLLYHPSICNGVIAFSCFGDIWTVREDGTALRRITDHPGRDVHPVLSPDGTMIAFTSNRTGPYNVFVIPATGGEARQLTWNTHSDSPVTWTPDGTKIVVHGPPRDSFNSWLYTVAAEGGMREALPVGEAAFGTFSRDGRYFVFNRKGLWEPWRKGYRGSADSDVWVADLEAGTFEKRTEFRGPDSWPLFAPNGDIYFVSERNGPKNLYRLPHRGGEPEQITHHDDPGVVYPSISPDGKTIAYQYNFSIWTVSTRGGEPKQVPITIVGEPKQDLIEWETNNSRADQFAVRPDGKRIAVSCHGQLFTVPTGKAGDKVRVTNDSARNRVPRYSPDGTKLAYISDSPAGERIFIYDRKTKEVTEIEPPASLMAVDLWTWNHNRMVFRPDSKALAFHAGHGLYVYDLETGETKLISEGTERSIEPSAWSPDGRWLAYSKLDTELLNPHLFVYSFDTGGERRLYDDPLGEWRPVFTPDGKYLLFLARRELDSGDMYDTTGRSRVVEEIYALALQKETVDPDEPPDPDAEKEDKAKDEGDDEGNGDVDKTADNEQTEEAGEEAAEEAEAGEAEKAEKAEGEEEGVKVEIDFDDVDTRTRRITYMVEPIWSWLLVTPDSKRVIFGVNEPRGDRRVNVVYSALIERTHDPKENLKEVAQVGWDTMQLADEGKAVFVMDGGAVKKVPVDGGKVETIEFSLSFPVDLRDEMRQMYFEAWRALRDGFYDETMHGVDWVAARQKYEPFLDSVSDKQEVMDLIIEMIGELNASHCGAWVGRGNQPWKYEDARQLGIELEPDEASGLYRVARIYEKGPADKSWLDLQVGDYVFAIAGHDLRAGDDYERLLVNPLNEKVPLRVGREPDPAAAREIRIEHVSGRDERTLWYESWVRRNEQYVEQKTDGRVGYLHIQGMNSRSLVKFKKDLTRLRNYEGLIIDVRYNGGGLIDDVLLDILNRRPYNITRSRGASVKRKRPEEAFYGVKAVLIDSFSFSDAEMFPDGFRTLGHGKLIGEPTAGGVIGTGAYWLIDGSVIRMPIWGIWSITGQSLENYGVPPDILVEHTPDEDVQGADRQLDAAIKEVLSEIGPANE
jgi:tricorn protease